MRGVNVLAAWKHAGWRWLHAVDVVGSAAATIALGYRLVLHAPAVLVLLGAMFLLAAVGRTLLLRHVPTA